MERKRMKAGHWVEQYIFPSFRMSLSTIASKTGKIVAIGFLVCLMGWQSTQATDSKLPADDTVERIMVVQEKLASLNRRIDKEKLLAEQGTLASQTQHNQNAIRLQEIKYLYQRILNTIKKNASLAAEEAEWRKAIESGEAYQLSEKKPYSLSYYDKLLDQAASAQQEEDVLYTSVASNRSKLDESKKELGKAEVNWRRAKEEASRTTEKTFEDDMDFVQAELDKEAAAAIVHLQTVLLDGLEREMRLVGFRKESAQLKLATIREDLAFDPDALNGEISRLQALKNSLNARFQLLLIEQKKVENQWQTDRETATSIVSESAMAAMDEWREAYETVLQQTEEMTQLLNLQQQLWKSRYALVREELEAESLNAWTQDAQATRKQTQQAIGLYQSWQVNQQAKMANLIDEKNTLGEAAGKYANFQMEALSRIGEYGSEYFSQLLATGQLATRLLDELNTRAEEVTWWERAKETGSRFNDVWNFELWAIDDNGVTVRKVVTAFVLLFIGILVLKNLLRFFSRRLERSKVDHGAIAAMEKLLLYTCSVFIILFALRTVNIPLTIFSFFGGAIAIGIGFGAQNLINNFISGFIILMERPIRVGDLIELDGRAVRVEEIGARCTRVKTGDNIHILIPNSSFLENNITNWTFSDKRIRVQVVVGVAYGSPLKQVTELLLKAAADTEKILDNPKPFVIFDDFGDSALIFEIYFWATIRGVVEKKRISSELRYHIDDLFNANNITIAFPQQDIHLDSTNPVQVELTTGDNPKSRPPEPHAPVDDFLPK
jgi:potassium efflux system protein